MGWDYDYKAKDDYKKDDDKDYGKKDYEEKDDKDYGKNEKRRDCK